MITDIVLSTISLPFRILSNLLRFLFSILGIPFPQLQYTRLTRPRPPTLTRAHDAWIRELEEETGAVCISTYQQRTAQASGAQAGPSTATLTKTHAGRNVDEKVLPDFMPGTYEEFLKACERELKVGCVILVSEEHDDVAEFKRCLSFQCITVLPCNLRFAALR
jgi:FAS-associated factor 2